MQHVVMAHNRERTSTRWGSLKQFLETERASGVFLVIATTVALAWANSPFDSSYEDLWSAVPVSAAHEFDLHHWVNEALMALFLAGKAKPHIHATYPLERAAEALNEVLYKRVSGKVVLTT